jgi:Glucosyl transferase GtrII
MLNLTRTGCGECSLNSGPLPRNTIELDLLLAVAVVMAVFCVLFFHGYEILQYTLSIDEELMLGTIDPLHYVQTARWGGIVLRWLKTPLPITPMVAGLGLYSTAFVLLVRRLQITNWESVVVAAGIYFGFPVLLHAFAFSNLTLTIGLGSLVAVLALWVASARSPARFILVSLLIAFGISLYQPFFSFVIVIFLADAARRIYLTKDLHWREQWLQLAWYGALVLSGLLFYGLIELALLNYFGQQLGYIPDLFQPAELASRPLLILKTSLREAWNLYSGSASTFLGFDLFYRLLVVLCLAILAWMMVSQWRQSKGGALLWAGLLAVIILAPFIQNPFNEGEMPLRTLVGLPAAIAILALFATEASPQRLRRWVILPLAGLVIVEFSAINNKQYFAGHWALQRDIVMGTQILSRIVEMFPKERNYTIAVVGAGPRNNDLLIPYVTSSTLGASFFQWDSGNPDRIAAFLNFLSSARFSPANPEQRERAFEAASVLPSWPDRGSIARVDGAVLIKLSEPSPLQLKTFCAHRSSEFCAKLHP